MKINHNLKYVAYVILFIIFILIRINYVLQSGEIEEYGYKSLCISHSFWPFGIIKQTALYDSSLPLYYLIIGVMKNEVFIKILNIIFSLLNIIIFINIGKKIYSEKLGLFLGFIIAINSFYLYYSNIISPYCLIFLIQALLINFLINYLKKPTKKNFKILNLLNIILIFSDTFGFLYVFFELYFLYLLGKRKKIYLKQFNKLFNYSFISFLTVFPILIIQYAISTKLTIPITKDSVGLNLNSLYLILNEYLTPYLSFLAPENQTKSTIGLLYSFFLNPDIKNINSLKILITLFYSSFLPLILMIVFSIKSCIKNYRLKILYLISLFYFVFILFLMLINKIPTQPVYTIPFFITSIILFGYGIFTIKDKFTKTVLISCLFLIQIINPEINSFNIKITKNYPSLTAIKNFIKDYEISSNDLIIMPHGQKLGSYYFKKQTFFDYDERDLILPKKNGIINNLINRKTKTINQKNIHYLVQDYLQEQKTNAFLTSYFVENIFKKEELAKRYIVVIDKLNSKPISKNSITKCANQKDYNVSPRKIDFRYLDLSQNQSETLFDALRSKTIYNFINLLNTNFKLDAIVEYKKIDNEYYKITPSNNIYKAVSSLESDLAFLIFKQ